MNLNHSCTDDEDDIDEIEEGQALFWPAIDEKEQIATSQEEL